MNDKIHNEYELGSRELFGEDRQRILYDQLRSWAQRKNKLKKQNAAINAEFRDVCNYALLNGIELTKYRLPEGKFIMKTPFERKKRFFTIRRLLISPY